MILRSDLGRKFSKQNYALYNLSELYEKYKIHRSAKLICCRSVLYSGTPRTSALAPRVDSRFLQLQGVTYGR